MNPLCTIHRKRISDTLDQARALPKTVREHLIGCQSCRDFHDQSRAAHDSLVTAGSIEPGSREGLHEGIMAAIREDAAAETRSAPARPGNIIHAWAPGLAAAAAVVVLGVTGWLLLHDSGVPNQAGEVESLAVTIPSFPDQLTASLDLTIVAPYEKELDSIAADIAAATRVVTSTITDRGGIALPN